MFSVRKLLKTISFFLFLSLWISSGEGAEPFWTPKVTEFKLKNGMKFLLVPRGDTPVFSARIAFKVGGIEEEFGKLGLAHMFEHMAFKGTKRLGTKSYTQELPFMKALDDLANQLNQELDKGEKADPKKIQEIREKMEKVRAQQQKYIKSGELTRLMMEHGGVGYNATTSKDMTQYFVSLPSDQLRFWAEIESQRIFKPVLRQFYSERDVVLEERRMRVDDNPGGQLYEALIEAAFEISPYRWSTLGPADNIRRLTRQDAFLFWKNYYSPANAVGVLVGNLDVESTKRILQNTFGRIPSRNPKLSPFQEAISVDQLEKPHKELVRLERDAEPLVMMAFPKPTLPHRDDYVFDLIDRILAGGRTSWLYQELVKKKKVASSVTTFTSIPAARLPNLFLIEAKPYGNKNISKTEKEIWKALNRLKSEKLSDKELAIARHKIVSDIIWHMKTNKGLASLLAYYEILVGSWKYMVNYPSHIDSISAEEIQKVARKYFIKDNSVTAELVRKASQ